MGPLIPLLYHWIARWALQQGTLFGVLFGNNIKRTRFTCVSRKSNMFRPFSLFVGCYCCHHHKLNRIRWPPISIAWHQLMLQVPRLGASEPRERVSCCSSAELLLIFANLQMDGWLIQHFVWNFPHVSVLRQDLITSLKDYPQTHSNSPCA